MVDEKAPPRKQGLHGWKAALAVFGCGTLAAFGVFGIVLVIFGSFLSALSSGVGVGSQDVGGPGVFGAQPTAPREDFKSDAFELCGIIDSISSIQLSLVGEIEGPSDESISGGPPEDDDLVRSGSCRARVTPNGAPYPSGSWSAEISYWAVIYSPEDGRDDLAGGYLEEVASEVGGGGVSIEESGSYDFLDEAQYFYGTPESGSGTFYSVVARKRSGVIVIRLDSDDQVDASAFSSEVQKLHRRLDNDMRDLIPR
ncbi:hypothetical protein [Nocardiopsis lambiniae]|uniref:DUF3558 domain-containing protein n=1 Tax=Nocardiopsis lambiniae TaxID=3075539 RepID=A0ABU2M5M6_9ACTN|nr:hypothetical protein [Nocardiopsis sp. DSM 44743]MDT0327883.1 hypothetical protein [Nocardiopsis sp. DSM 44743]